MATQQLTKKELASLIAGATAVNVIVARIEREKRRVASFDWLLQESYVKKTARRRGPSAEHGRRQ